MWFDMGWNDDAFFLLINPSCGLLVAHAMQGLYPLLLVICPLIENLLMGTLSCLVSKT